MLATTHFNHFVLTTDKEHVVLDADALEVGRFADLGEAMTVCKVRDLLKKSDDCAKQAADLSAKEAAAPPEEVVAPPATVSE